MNNKQLLFIAILFWFPFLAFAQKYQYVPIQDSGSVWSEMYSSEESMVVYERFTLTGEDTLINNISYKKLYIFYDKTFNKNKAKCVGGIREDEKKRVYFKGDSIIHKYKPFWITAPPMDELLLYDFSLGVGDTVKFDKNSRVSLCVISIDTVQIGNSQRKVFKFDYSDASWIEGIGNTRGLLFSSLSLSTGGESGDLICFIQNDTVLYHCDWYDDCFPATANNGFIKTELDITVCPNPVTGNCIHFKLGNNNIKTIELFDLQGMFIDSVNIQGEKILEYPVQMLSPGIYIYKVTSYMGYQQTGKFSLQ